jgi:GT2 family glycosyltransferase
MTNTAPAGPLSGVVVIGRNERPRLAAALAGIDAATARVVYVDSGSSDGSTELAESMAVPVLRLDPATLFSAARARNEGFAWLAARYPGLVLVQFLDGDCVLDANWLATAQATLVGNAQYGIVVGQLAERYPDQSIYNRLCALEWKGPAGELTQWGEIGGIMAVRPQVFTQLNGFNNSIIAGEDSEFGVRVGLAGFKIVRLAAAMATHDADMHRFGQWWQRSVRAGHAVGQRYAANGHTAARDGAKQRRSIGFWGLALPGVALLLAWPTSGLSLAGLGLAYGYQFTRIARYKKKNGEGWADSFLYSFFTVVGRWPNALGFLKYQISRRRGQFSIIEHK